MTEKEKLLNILNSFNDDGENSLFWHQINELKDINIPDTLIDLIRYENISKMAKSAIVEYFIFNGDKISIEEIYEIAKNLLNSNDSYLEERAMDLCFEYDDNPLLIPLLKNYEPNKNYPNVSILRSCRDKLLVRLEENCPYWIPRVVKYIRDVTWFAMTDCKKDFLETGDIEKTIQNTKSWKLPSL